MACLLLIVVMHVCTIGSWRSLYQWTVTSVDEHSYSSYDSIDNRCCHELQVVFVKEVERAASVVSVTESRGQYQQHPHT